MSRITLTFDNGPVPGGTDLILDALAARNLPAVFFVIGTRLDVDGAPDLLDRIVAAGHRIGNHTMHHEKPLGQYDADDDASAEISALDSRLSDLGHSTRLFRPPGKGVVGPHLLRSGALDYLRKNDFTVVTWNNVPGDWKEPRDDWYETAVADLENQDWTVLVLHDWSQEDMPDLLHRFLDLVVERGLEVRTDFPDECLPMVDGELRVPAGEICTDAA